MMFLLYLFVLASYGCYITHNISSMGKFSKVYCNLNYESALSLHTMSCVENAVKMDMNKLNEEYVDNYTVGDGKGTDKGGGDNYFRSEELTKGRFVKNIKYTYRGMDLRPRHSSEPPLSELYQNMEKKRILETLENMHVSVPIKLNLCDYVNIPTNSYVVFRNIRDPTEQSSSFLSYRPDSFLNKQYLSDSSSCSNLLGGGLLNDGDWCQVFLDVVSEKT